MSTHCLMHVQACTRPGKDMFDIAHKKKKKVAKECFVFSHFNLLRPDAAHR